MSPEAIQKMTECCVALEKEGLSVVMLLMNDKDNSLSTFASQGLDKEDFAGALHAVLEVLDGNDPEEPAVKIYEA